MRSEPMKLGELALNKATWWPRLQINPKVMLLGLGLYALFFGGLAFIQFATPNLLDNDGYYHIKLAQLMRQQGPTPAFLWLPLTVLNLHSFVDHHLLYHILLIPFTFGDLREGAKWASVVWPAFTFAYVGGPRS